MRGGALGGGALGRRETERKVLNITVARDSTQHETRTPHLHHHHKVCVVSFGVVLHVYGP